MIRALLLDSDGTLVDTERLQWRAYREALAPFGVPVGLDEYRRHFIRVAGGPEWACRRYALPVAPWTRGVNLLDVGRRNGANRVFL